MGAVPAAQNSYNNSIRDHGSQVPITDGVRTRKSVDGDSYQTDTD